MATRKQYRWNRYLRSGPLLSRSVVPASYLPSPFSPPTPGAPGPGHVMQLLTHMVPSHTQVLAQINGFNLTAALDEPPDDVPNDFRFKPFVALVSHFANAVVARATQLGQMQQVCLALPLSTRSIDACITPGFLFSGPSRVGPAIACWMLSSSI